MATEPATPQGMKYHPSLNLQGETCCCFIELRVGVIMIGILTVTAAISQYFYEQSSNFNEWWLWIYVGLCTIAAIIGIASACLYKPLLAKIYCGWLVISCIIWIVDGVLYADDTLGYTLTFTILVIKIYFVYVLWKFSKIISTPYQRLNTF